MSGKNILKESFVKVKGFVFGFVLSVVLVAGAVFAAGGAQNMQNKWDAFWHGTSWIQAGKVVESERIAENFEYLKREVDDIRGNKLDCYTEKKKMVRKKRINITSGQYVFYETVACRDGYIATGGSVEPFWIEDIRQHSRSFPLDNMSWYCEQEAYPEGGYCHIICCKLQ